MNMFDYNLLISYLRLMYIVLEFSTDRFFFLKFGGVAGAPVKQSEDVCTIRTFKHAFQNIMVC